MAEDRRAGRPCASGTGSKVRARVGVARQAGGCADGEGRRASGREERSRRRERAPDEQMLGLGVEPSETSLEPRTAMAKLRHVTAVF